MVVGGEPRRKVAGETACKESSPDDCGSDRDHSRSVAGLAFRRAWRDMARTVDSVARAGQSLFHIGMRLLGPCLVIMALVLKGFVTCTFFWHALPTMQDRAGLIGSSLLSFVGVFLLLNALYNYYKAVFTSAGLPPEFEKAKVSLVESSENPEVVPRKCPKCALLKPPRAHHCSVCGVCVMKMDHHCPWINNCVGFGNYRYFCLFLLFLGMACFFVVCVFGVFFHDVIFSWSRQGTRAFRQCILTSFMICASILAAVCFLGGFHTFLVMTNQTTIEFQINMMKRRESRYNGEFFRNPYDMGRSRNCQEVFGPNRLWSFIWLFPWMGALPPTGDGLKYASISRLQV